MTTRSRTADMVLAAPRSTWALFLGAVLFAALTGVGAAVSVPLWFSPVPVTLQTLFVVLAGAALGPLWGPLSQVLYVGAGTLGLPVFAGGAAGAGVLAGPTGGYLVGFVAGAWIAGLITRPGASWLRLVLGFAAAHAAVFVCGLSHLMLFTAQSPALAVKLGLLPFLPGLAVKLAASVGIVRSRRLAGWFRP